MVKSFFKSAIRSLIKGGGSGIINIVGLALSLVLVILIGLWIQNESRYDNYHRQAANKYLIKNTDLYDNGNSKTKIYTPYNAISHLQSDYPEIKSVAYGNRGYASLKIAVGNQVFSEGSRMRVSQNWFDFFQYDAIHLDTAAFNRQPHSVILTENRAIRYFGHTDIMGERLTIDSTDYLVQGVLRNNPSNSSFDFDVLLPIDDGKQLEEAYNWMYFNTIVFVETKSATNITQAEQKINTLFSKNIQWTQSGISNRMELLPLTELHFDDSLPQIPFGPIDYRYIVIFGTLAIFILLVSAINYVNFTLAQAFSRVKELGARRIVGAGSRHLFLQILVESVVSCTIALGVAVLIAWLVIPIGNDYFSLKLSMDFGAWHIYMLLFGLWVGLIILSGAYPALHLSSIRAIHLFRNFGLLGFGGKKIRRALLVTQLSLAIVMMVAVLTMYRQLEHIQSESDIFGYAQTFMVEIPPVPFNPTLDRQANRQHEAIVKKTLKDKLLQSPHIRHLSTTVNSSIIDEQYLMVGNLDWDGKPPGFQAQYGNWPVDEDLAKVMDFEIVNGRWFLGGDSTDQHGFVVNETAVREFNIEPPVVGTRIDNNGREGVIVGVVKDFRFQNLRETTRPMVFYKENNWGMYFLVKAHAGTERQALQDVEGVMKARFPNAIFNYRFLDEEFDAMYRKDLQTMTVASTVSLTSILLSMVGLLGMVMFECRQRTKEIGIRKVLGATVAGIVTMVSKDFVKLVLLAVGIATPIAWWAMNTWLEDFAYRIDMQWWMFATAGAAAVMIALLTVSWQAIRTAVANPVDSLRDE